MSSLFQKALLYLGLVDEEGLDEEQPEIAAVAPLQSNIRTVSGNDAHVRGRRVEPPEDAGYPGASAVRATPRSETRADIVTAVTFDDAKTIADRIRGRQAVVLNMRDTDPDMVRRLIDFASGLTYGLDGTMGKIAEGVILILPHGLSLGRAERRRLADLDLYAVDDE
ncbi:cell division protein SepF [bacterium BMS3Abin02]|nr:cell division protein SepF [bacterium BMS3Abin02]GBE23697.1 cell division protein SepF [bacterium BMS3Bbin01]HDH24763.1 cell division protein SepF [Actinomycetota bacterium]